MNPFQQFALEPTLTLDLDELRDSYQKLAAKHHPDQSDNNANSVATFEQINQHYTILKSPAKRLKAYMEAKHILYDPRGAVSNDLMDSFMQVGALIQQADAFIRKKSSVTSMLAKALLEDATLELQDSISELISTLETHQQNIYSTLSTDPTKTNLPQVTRNLTFLENWTAQLQQRYGSLF